MTEDQSSRAPFLQIAADLRHRISTGELKPGERVPSTRQLQKTWGVALATAAKALTRLSQEGVLKAEPRFGYVVAPRRGADTVDRGGVLTVDRIARAAVELADVEGLAALSMRGVAARMRVPTMSLYRHVESRDALLLRMVDTVFAEEPPPARAGSWRQDLETAARVQWGLCRRHQWLPHVMSLTRPMLLPHVVQYANWVFAAMDSLPVDAATRMYVHMTLYSYVRGVAINMEGERQAEAETGLTEEEWLAGQAAELAAIAKSSTLPAFGRLLRELGEGFEPQLEDIFELGLRALLDGLAPLLESGRGWSAGR